MTESAAPDLAAASPRKALWLAQIFYKDIEKRLDSDVFEIGDALMTLHAFDALVKASRMASESMSDPEVTAAFAEFHEDIGAGAPTRGGRDGLRALRNILAHFDEYLAGTGRMGAYLPFHPFIWTSDSGRRHLYFRDVGGLDLALARDEADRLLDLIAKKLRDEGPGAQEASPD